MTIIKEGKTKSGKHIRLINDGLKRLEIYSIEEFVTEKNYTGWRQISGIFNNLDKTLASFEKLLAQ